MAFFKAVFVCLWKCADFRGRARRSEFWCYSLFWTLSCTVATLQLQASGPVALKTPSLATLFGSHAWWVLLPIALLVPFAAVAVRRLHDINVSGWWLLSATVPVPVVDLFIVGAQVFCFARPGTVGDNRYGPDPRQAAPSLRPGRFGWLDLGVKPARVHVQDGHQHVAPVRVAHLH
jgi:uncharacterized membrane protein YhaH (DUF805 family)